MQSQRSNGSAVSPLRVSSACLLDVCHDVVQEVFTRVFWKSSLYRGGSNFRAWLYGITSNQALSVLRTERRGVRRRQLHHQPRLLQRQLNQVCPLNLLL